MPSHCNRVIVHLLIRLASPLLPENRKKRDCAKSRGTSNDVQVLAEERQSAVNRYGEPRKTRVPAGQALG